MALVYIDSFDTYQTADLAKRYSSVGDTPDISAGNGRTGAALYCISGEYVGYGLTPSTQYLVGFAFKPVSFDPQTGCFLGFVGPSYDQIQIGTTSTGAIRVCRGASPFRQTGNTLTGTELYVTAGGVLTQGVWQYVEAYCKVDDSVGEVEVRVNGVTVVDLSGIDTHYTATYIYNIDIGAANDPGYFDDLYICDTSGSVNNSFLGDVTVEAIFPQTDAVAAGTHEDFTCSTGADQGAMVDESSSDFPDEDSTYITSSTDTHRSTFNYPDITPASADILGVQINICAKKSDTGTRTYTSAIRSGGSDYDGETELSKTVAPSDTSYAYGTFVHEVDPDTSTAWTVGGVNAAEFGVLITE